MILPDLPKDELHIWIKDNVDRINLEIREAKKWLLEMQETCPHTQVKTINNFKDYVECTACRKVVLNNKEPGYFDIDLNENPVNLTV